MTNFTSIARALAAPLGLAKESLNCTVLGLAKLRLYYTGMVWVWVRVAEGLSLQGL